MNILNLSQFFKIRDELVPTAEPGARDDKLVASHGLKPPEGGHLSDGVAPYKEYQGHLTVERVLIKR